MLMRKKLTMLLLLVLSCLGMKAGTVTDVLTAESMNLPISSRYEEFKDIRITSEAVYNVFMMRYPYAESAFQFRTNNNNSGIVTAKSGGIASKVTVKWFSSTSTTGNRALQFYGSNEPYSDPAELFSTSTAGTLIKELVCDESLEGEIELTGAYKYIGMRSKEGAVYFESISIDWTVEEGAVSTPTFSIPGGEVKMGTEIALSCATQDAEIHYTLDGTDPTAESELYTTPIKIEDVVTIKAIAYKDGEVSLIATAEYGILPYIESLTSLADAPDGAKFQMGTDLIVVYCYGAYNYIYDGTSYSLIYQYDLGLEEGDVIEAGWLGMNKIYSGGLPEIIPQETLVVKEKGAEVPEPKEVTEAEVAQLLTVGNANQYYMLKEIVIDDYSTTSEYTGVMGDNSITLFSKTFGVVPEEAGTYNVSGFVTVYNGNAQFLPIRFNNSVEKIESLSALVDFPDNTTVQIAAEMTVAYANEAINLIYDGVNFMGLVANQNLEEGDVIKAGWLAVYADKKLQAAGSLTIDGKAEVPQPKEITPEMLMYPQPNWDYQVLTPILLAADMAQGGMGEAYGQFESEEGPENVPVQVLDILGVGPVEKGQYNIRGFWMQYNLGDDEYTTVFVPIEFAPYYEKVDNFSALVDFPDNTTVEIAANATVAYANETINLIYDGVNFMGLVANQNLEEGDVIKAGWLAVYADQKLQAAGTLTIDGTADVPEPKEIEAEMLMYKQPNWDYQVLLNINAPEGMGEGMKTVYAQFTDPDEGRVDIPIQLYNYLYLDEVEPGYYNIRGFWMPLNLGEEYMETFVPIELTPAKAVIDNLNALVDVPEGEEFIYGGDLTVAYITNSGFIGVYDGTTFGMICDDPTAFEVGDIIKGGWNAAVYEGMLFLFDYPEISGKAEPAPSPVPVAAEDVYDSQYLWNWISMDNVVVPSTYWEDGYVYATYTVEDEQGTWTFYNWFMMIDYFAVTEEGMFTPGTYNVVGTWLQDYDYGWVLVPTSFEDVTPAIDSFNVLADIPSETIVVVDMDLSVSTQTEVFFEVYDGIMFGAVSAYDDTDYEEFEFEDGAVINKGWRAIVADNMLIPIFHDLTSTTTTTPQPAVEVEAMDLEYSKYPFNYLTVMNVTVEEPIAADDYADLTATSIVGGEAYTATFTLNNYFGVEIPTGQLDITGVWYKYEIAWANEGDDEFGVQYVFFPLETRDTQYDGVENVSVDNGEVEYFNINGMKIDEPKAGSIVIRVVNGKAEKFIKK